MLVDSQRGQPSFESESHHHVTMRKRNGAASCLVRRTEICTWELCSELFQHVMHNYKDGRRRLFVYNGIYLAGQGRQQRIVCVKDLR